ncbi:MAG: winged helix-turn-helix transcriptional regulator [Candidatus Kerfeldbacteria bacterium]|nr:winged helix-turn-helix transcriptional regulator [Candidatus Kerfeldbacteria bacterium]
MHTNPEFRDGALVFRALGNERRLYILSLLRRGSMTGDTLTRMLCIHPASTSKHLHRMLRARLITSRRSGRCVRFSLARAVKNHKELQRFLLECFPGS